MGFQEMDRLGIENRYTILVPILTSAPSKQPAYFSFIESLWETDSLQSVPEIISWMWSTVVITTPTEIFQTIIIPSLEHWSDMYLIIFCHQLADGLFLEKTSCPLGVLLIVFESRPDALVQVNMIRIMICLRWWPEDNFVVSLLAVTLFNDI